MKRLLVSVASLCLATSAAASTGEAGRDAFLSSAAAHPLAVDAEALLQRGARVDGFERRLGVPTILWSEGEHTGSAPAPTPAGAARLHLQRFADLYRLAPADAAESRVQGIHDTGSGAVIAQFGQSVNGVEVFRNRLSVVMDRNLELVAITGWLAPSELLSKARSATFRLGASGAVARAFRTMSGVELDPASFAAGGSTGPWQRFGLDRPAAGWRFSSPARAKQIFFTLPERLVPAWYVEIHAGDGARTGASYESFVISAEDGSLLFRNDLRADADYGYRVWADPTTHIPWDGPAGWIVSPHPTGQPDRIQFPAVATEEIVLQNFPFSRSDPWLPANASETRGNNVDAYADLFAPDGFQSGADVRATTTAPGLFGAIYDTAQGPGANATQRQASVTTLFYLTNFFHDWYYDAGFDEAAGNTQSSNFGRGGWDGDPLLAEAQDHSGRNNANMWTPADGASPVLQAYVFDGLPILQVTAPASIAGMVETETASFGAQQYNVSGTVQIPNPSGTTLGCTAFPAGTFAGTVAVIDRGTCTFAEKALNAQNAGASAVIIANNVAGQPAPGLGGTAPIPPTVPVISVTRETADGWKAAVRAGSTITVAMERSPRLDRDGTVDAAIIAHEWGHLISNRLIGDANGLDNYQGAALGEGWGDIHALLLLVDGADRNLPGNNQWQGLYPIATWVESGGANNGYYFGIRRAPYSTDFGKNALTFKHIANATPLPTTSLFASGQSGLQNAESHNAGEVWASMLWECYASLLNAYPFSEAQGRMKAYLVASYKATPVMPTLLEARDALLAIAAASDPADLPRFRAAFAKRGAGAGAIGPDRDSQDFIGVTESYEAGANIATGYRLDDSVAGCDLDGVLDVGETGRLTVTVRNTGWSSLGAFNGTISSAGGGATFAFPNGNNLLFPPLAPGQSAQRSVPVQLTAASGFGARGSLSIAWDNTLFPAAARTMAIGPVVQYDVSPGGATSDAFEGARLAWTGTEPGDWVRAGTEDNRHLHAADRSAAGESVLESPWLDVNPTGDFTLSFKHRHSFETSRNGGAPYWDGGVIEISLDGNDWYDVFEELGINPGYTAYLEEGGNPLSGRAAFVGLSAGFPAWARRSVNFGTLFDGMRIKVRFRAGFDEAVGAYGWDLDDVSFTNLANAPLYGVVAEPAGSVCNQRPVASAADVERLEGVLDGQGLLQRNVVTLDGGGSFDPDGGTLAYTWTQLSGPAVTLANANTAFPSFVADVAEDTHYAFQLTVSDGTDSSYPETIDVAIWNVNQPPVAIATAPISVDERSVATVTLDGSGSSDPDGEPLSYAWTQLAGPEVILDDPGSATPSFELPEVDADTTFVFGLLVDDGLEASEEATVAVTVVQIDRPVTADAGSDQLVPSRSEVALAGTAIDPDGDAIALSWTQLAGPPVILDDASAERPAFMAPSVLADTDLVFELTASANGTVATDTVVITVEAEPLPAVDAGADLAAPGRSTVVLRGSAADGATLLWTQLLGPAVELDRTDAPVAVFVLPDVKEETTLVFQLTAIRNGASASDTVAITVAADGAPVAVAGPAIDADARTLVQLGGEASDPEGDLIVAWTWTQLSGSSVELVDADTRTPSFTAPDVRSEEELVFALVATANGLSSEPATAVVRIHPVNRAPTAVAPEDRTVDEGQPVSLAADGSDADGDTLAFHWVQVGGPAVELSGADSNVASFVAPAVGADTDLAFELVATDVAGLESAPALVRVHVRNVNEGPVASARATVHGRFVTLDGSASADPDGGSLRYAWVQTGGDPVELDGVDGAVATFEMAGRKAASLAFELVVTDGAGSTATAPVTVELAAVKAPKKESSGGCSSSGGSAGPLSLLLVAGAAHASRRRRR